MPEKILSSVFGYEAFRPLQKEAIEHILEGKDALVIMPTGGGKSLCYQVPALMLEGVTLVISPLIALMKDQVDHLQHLGVPAAFWNSSLPPQEIDLLCHELAEGKIKLLYIAPERLAPDHLPTILRRLPVSLIAIDEAHCVSEWGHDFRPAYRQLAQLKELFPKAPRVALTATATARVQEDIAHSLKLDDPLKLTSSFNRTNLFIDVRSKSETFGQIQRYLKKEERGPGIIYCASRSRTEDLANKLAAQGFRALPYHAGLSPNRRAEAHEKFLKDEAQIIVATIAFGMGIDKPNIRFVIHHDLPKSIENYYQEIGRAGRDGLPSECLLFASYADKFIVESFIDKLDDPEEAARQKEKLDQMIRFATGRQCRRKSLLNYFGEAYPLTNCRKCDICDDPEYEPIDTTVLAQKVICTVIRLQERFGIGMVLDVLKGADSEKVRRINGTSLSVYGVAKDESRTRLKAVLEELLRKEYLRLEGVQYPICKVTPKGREAVKSRETIMLSLPPPPKERKREKVIDYDDTLYQKLRQLRTDLAKQFRVAPFTIMHDRSLQEMAAKKPTTTEEMLAIHGVGDHKMRTVGKPFLEAIKSSL